MDSANACNNLIAYGSSGAAQSHELCRAIFSLAREHRITIQPIWVPREENQIADKNSKLFDRGVIRQPGPHYRPVWGPFHFNPSVH